VLLRFVVIQGLQTRRHRVRAHPDVDTHTLLSLPSQFYFIKNKLSYYD
jgi:hypothetical protein